MKKYGSFWRRFFAALIDLVIVSFIPGISAGNNETASLLWFILATAYEVWMVGMYGATIGKMVLKLKITKENGGKVSYSDALVRSLAGILSVIVFGLGFLWVIWDKKKQSWHDKLAKTVVVKV